jgi:quercetin dioxygenase-like cupin family protein
MAECRVFTIDEGLKEVVPGGLYMKHLFGTNVSVSVVKFVEEKGGHLSAKPHTHGEEVSLQLVGSCSVFADNKEYVLCSGEALIMPAGVAHTGKNVFKNGVCLRLNIVTPPRAEFGPEDGPTYYPLKDESQDK